MLAIDTGILLRAINAQDPNYQTIKETFKVLRKAGWSLVTFPQNISEFWVVSTRPLKDNGYGLSVEEAYQRVVLLEKIASVLPEHDDSYEHWKKLVQRYHVRGKPTHDARIVAQMIAYEIGTIVTLNPKDFRRFEGIRVLTPQEAIAI